MDNRELISKYPFLQPRNIYTDNILEDYDFEYTLLDSMPDGWRIAFGEELCEKINSELNKLNYRVKDSYRILQIKEKFGALCWYTNWTTESIENILSEYEERSKKTCCLCGAPATKISVGWISPYCDECAERVFSDSQDFYPIEEYFKRRKNLEENFL